MQQIRRKNFIYLLYVISYLVLIAWALLQGWNSRFFEHYDDGISYLDMADYFIQGEWAKGFSCFWNPLYPLVIALIFSILRPDIVHEFIALKLVNFIIFIGLLVAFQYFLKAFISFYTKQIKNEKSLCAISDKNWYLLAYGIFAYAFLCLGGISNDTPDMLAACFTFSAFGLVLKIHDGEGRTNDYFWFGICAGLTYIAKSAALPILFMCLIILWYQGNKHSKQAMKQFLLSIIALLVIFLPYSYCVCRGAGEFILSPAAKLNYIWFVQEKNANLYGQVNAISRPFLKHPVRLIYEHPKIYEFAQPVQGTYPIWFDPYYWYAGYKIQFCPDWLFITFICNLIYYTLLLFGSFFLIVLLIVLIYRKPIISLRSFYDNQIIIIPALFGFLQYAFIINLLVTFPVLVNRYFSSAIVLFVLGALASIRIQNDKNGIFALKAGVIGIYFCLFISLGLHFMDDIRNVCTQKIFAHNLIAQELNKFDLDKNAYVAQIGKEESLVDWAKLARLKIVISIPESKEFWSLTPQRREEIFMLLKKYGVKMVVYIASPLNDESKALWTFNHKNPSERLGFLSLFGQRTNNETESFNAPLKALHNEGWQQISNLPCWLHKI